MSPRRGDPVGDRWKAPPFREEVAELAAVAPLSWRVVLVEQWGALWPPDPDHKLTGENPPRLRVAMRTAEYMRGRTYPPATAADLAELERDRGPLAVLELVGRLWRYMAQGGAPAEGNEPQAFNPPPLYLWTLAAGTVDKEGGTTGRPAVELMDRLARRLWGRLAELVARLPLTAEALEARGLAEDDGLLWLDRAMVAEVRRVYGVELGTDAARERWSAWERGEGGACALLRPWLDPEAEGPVPAAWAGELARLELELLRAELVREPEAAAPLVWQSNEDFLRRKHPSLLLAAGGPLVRSLVRARPVDGGLLVDADNRQIPLALRSTVEGLIVGDLAALGTAAAQRLVRMVVEAGAVAAYGAGRPVLYSTAPRVEVYKDRVTGDAVLSCWGGWPALARLCGLEGHKGRDQVKDAAYALAAVSLRWKGPKKGGGADALLGVRDGDTTGHEDYRAAPGREARVVLRISPPLAPGLTHDMPKGRRALAPVLRDPPALPRALDRHAAAIGRADFLAMFEARALALDLYNEDRIALPWDRVFEEAAVPRQARGPALEALQGSPEAPRWVRLTATYWTLAEAGPPGDALAWLKEAGRQEASGSRAGKAGAATRQGRAKRRKP